MENKQKSILQNHNYIRKLPIPFQDTVKRFEESIGEWTDSRREPLSNSKKDIITINQKWKDQKKLTYLPQDMLGVGGLKKSVKKSTKSGGPSSRQLTLKL